MLVTYGAGPRAAWRLYDAKGRVVAESLTAAADVSPAGDGFVLSTDAGMQYVDAAGHSIPVNVHLSAGVPWRQMTAPSPGEACSGRAKSRYSPEPPHLMESSPRSMGTARCGPWAMVQPDERWCARPWPAGHGEVTTSGLPLARRTSRARDPPCSCQADARCMSASTQARPGASALVPTPRARARPSFSGSGPRHHHHRRLPSPVPPLPRRRQDLRRPLGWRRRHPTTPGRPIRQRRTRGHRGLAGSSALATIHSRCRPAMARARQGSSRALTPAHGGVTRVLEGRAGGARANGLQIPERGRIPSEVRKQYQADSRPDRPGGRARAADPAAALDRIAHRCEVSTPVAGGRRRPSHDESLRPLDLPSLVRENLIHVQRSRQRPDQQLAGGPATHSSTTAAMERSATRPSGSPRPGSG